MYVYVQYVHVLMWNSLSLCLSVLTAQPVTFFSVQPLGPVGVDRQSGGQSTVQYGAAVLQCTGIPVSPVS